MDSRSRITVAEIPERLRAGRRPLTPEFLYDQIGALVIGKFREHGIVLINFYDAGILHGKAQCDFQAGLEGVERHQLVIVRAISFLNDLDTNDFDGGLSPD